MMNNEFFKTMMDSQKNMMDQWQDMYKNFANPSDNPYTKSMNDFFELQKKYMDYLAKNQVGDVNKLFMDYFKQPGFDPKAFEFFTEMQKTYMDQMTNYFSKMPDFAKAAPFNFTDMSKWMGNADSINEYFEKIREYYNPFEMGKAFSPAMRDLLEKMMKANTYYLNLYKFWKEMEASQVQPVMDEVKKYTQEILEKYDLMFKDMVLPMLPQEFQAFAKEPMELMKQYAETSRNFFAPWLDNSKELRDLFAEGMIADKTKLGEFFELWRAQFDKTFGAMLLSPSMGINKELIEQQSKAFDTYINMLLLSTDFTSRIFAVQQENMDDMISKYLEMAEQGVQPKTFNEFYTYWSNELEKIFDSYFATPEYTKLLGQLSSAAMEYRIEMQQLLERYLVDTPIVTRSEINSLYKTIYDLKKEVKAMKKAQKEAASAEVEK